MPSCTAISWAEWNKAIKITRGFCWRRGTGLLHPPEDPSSRQEQGVRVMPVIWLGSQQVQGGLLSTDARFPQRHLTPNPSRVPGCQRTCVKESPITSLGKVRISKYSFVFLFTWRIESFSNGSLHRKINAEHLGGKKSVRSSMDNTSNIEIKKLGLAWGTSWVLRNKNSVQKPLSGEEELVAMAPSACALSGNRTCTPHAVRVSVLEAAEDPLRKLSAQSMQRTLLQQLKCPQSKYSLSGVKGLATSPTRTLQAPSCPWSSCHPWESRSPGLWVKTLDESHWSCHPCPCPPLRPQSHDPDCLGFH